MPIKKQAVKIKSSAKSAAKASVKAKKVVSVSYGYGTGKKKSGYGHKKKAACKPVKYVCNTKKRCKKVVRKSAFRANANQNQLITANNSVQIAFGGEVFDLGGEYNPATSTFRAKQNGIYTFFASILFVTSESGNPVFVQTSIIANGDGVLFDTENLTLGTGVINTSGVVKLRRGDDVQVRFSASHDGTILRGVGTHFDGSLTRVTK